MIAAHRLRTAAALTAASALIALGAAGLAGTTAHAATGAGASFGPDITLRELHASVEARGVETTLHWRENGRLRVIDRYDLSPVDERSVLDANRGTTVFGALVEGQVDAPVVVRNAARVAPDGHDALHGELMRYAWPLVARVRSGTPRVLRPVTVGGRTLLSGTVQLAANSCAGLRRGARTVLLDSRTLVPVRVTDRRGTAVTLDLRALVRPGRPADFTALPFSGTRQSRDDGFVRRTPSAAAEQVPFAVSMPRALPAGFRLQHAGAAQRGMMIGPEGSFPRSNGVFFARFTRGLETLDLTIRGARSTLARDWDESDPFGAECTTARTADVQVGAARGRYAIGEDGMPRLWWRTGRVLYTLSGPFPAKGLIEVATSLERVR